MKFDVKAIARTQGADMAVQAVAAPDDIGLAFPGFTFDGGSQVAFQGTIQNAGHGLLILTGKASADYEALCARCLAPIRRSLTVDIRETFRSNQRVSGERLPEPEENGDIGSYEYTDYTVDVTDAVRENLLPALPIRELCREDCAGICPICGADRNLGACGCPDDPDAQKQPSSRLKDLL